MVEGDGQSSRRSPTRPATARSARLVQNETRRTWFAVEIEPDRVVPARAANHKCILYSKSSTSHYAAVADRRLHDQIVSFRVLVLLSASCPTLCSTSLPPVLGLRWLITVSPCVALSYPCRCCRHPVGPSLPMPTFLILETRGHWHHYDSIAHARIFRGNTHWEEKVSVLRISWAFVGG